MNKPNLSKTLKDMQKVLEKHSPEILVGIGILTGVTSTVMAVKATPKALQLIEAKKKEAEKDELTPLETVQTCWKCYVPAAMSGAASIACLVGANSVHVKRNAALATAYKLSESALAEYSSKVIETVGEKKEQTIREKIAEDKLKKHPIESSEVIMTDKGVSNCLDPISGRYFKTNIDKLKRAEKEIHNRILSSPFEYASLNEFYDEIGLDHTSMGDDIGWNLTTGISIDIHAQVASDGTPCLVLDYLVAPRYDYM